MEPFLILAGTVGLHSFIVFQTVYLIFFLSAGLMFGWWEGLRDCYGCFRSGVQCKSKSLPQIDKKISEEVFNKTINKVFNRGGEMALERRRMMIRAVLQEE